MRAARAASTAMQQVTTLPFTQSSDQACMRADLRHSVQDTIYDIAVKDITGEDVQLSKYKGKVVLVVNVASQCGFTVQYSERPPRHHAAAARAQAHSGWCLQRSSLSCTTSTKSRCCVTLELLSQLARSS